MPPKPKITKDDIINAGFEIVRRNGWETVSVRTVAAALGCSTQPIMYHYKTVEELKADIYAAADNFHTDYIMNIDGSREPPLTVGLNYIRFAAEESKLFRFLFQSDKFKNTSISEITSADGLRPVIRVLVQRTGLSEESARRLFETLFFCVHGLASLLADNSMEYSEEYCENMLVTLFKSLCG